MMWGRKRKEADLKGSMLYQMQSRAWAMEPIRLQALAEQLDAEATYAASGSESIEKAKAAAPKGPNYILQPGGRAVIPIVGIVTPTWDWILEWYDIPQANVDQIARNIGAALADPAVQSILYLVDSPGGTLDGVADLADYIYASRDSKPASAHINECGCSAAYWLACSAGPVTANQTAIVGSIGVYTVAYDLSRRAEGLGIRVHVIRSAALKGGGVPGAQIDQGHLEMLQELIDEWAGMFTSAVARGRGVSVEAAEKWSLGRPWTAAQALSLGLIDDVRNTEESLAALPASNSTGEAAAPPMEENDMSNGQAATQAATAGTATEISGPAPKSVEALEAMESAFPGAENATFVREQWKAGASIDQARSAHYDVLQGRIGELQTALAASRQETAAARAELEELKVSIAKTGSKPLGQPQAESPADPVAGYEALVDRLAKSGDPMPEATIAEKYPAVAEAYISAANQRQAAAKAASERAAAKAAEAPAKS